MRAELYNYDIFPKVFLVNEEAHITIKPLGAHAAFSDVVQVSINSLIHGLPIFGEESEYRILLEQEKIFCSN